MKVYPTTLPCFLINCDLGCISGSEKKPPFAVNEALDDMEDKKKCLECTRPYFDQKKYQYR
jgi:hypothetical protein